MDKVIRDSGLIQAMMPAESIRQAEAVRRVIDPTGKINPREASPFRTPLVMTWDSGSSRWKPAARAGSIAIIRARCDTAPSTGDATVSVSMDTEAGGIESLGTLTIPQGQRMADATLQVDVPAGAWVKATVTTAEGASGVDLSLTLEV